MNNLGNFFDKFKHIFQDIKYQKGAVLSTIRDITRIELGDDDIEIKDYKIMLKTSPAVKNAVFIYKQKILAELKKVLGPKAPTDIR